MELSSPEVLCPNCRLSDLCLPYGLQENEVKQLATIVKKNVPWRLMTFCIGRETSAKAYLLLNRVLLEVL